MKKKGKTTVVRDASPPEKGGGGRKEKKPKIEPPVVNVRAGGEGERIVLAKFFDGAMLEVTFRTKDGWHEVCSEDMVLDRIEAAKLPEKTS